MAGYDEWNICVWFYLSDVLRDAYCLAIEAQKMNLLLRPLENPNDPVWSVIIMVAMSVVGATYVIYYILRMAGRELDETLDKDQNID